MTAVGSSTVGRAPPPTWELDSVTRAAEARVPRGRAGEDPPGARGDRRERLGEQRRVGIVSSAVPAS